MKYVLIFGGLGLAGFLVWRFTRQPMQQPSQSYSFMGMEQFYPFQPINPPRQDYGAPANQPWSPTSGSNVASLGSSAGNLSGIGLDMNFQQNIQYLSGAASALESVNSIWGTVSSWFSTEPTSVMSGFDWSNSGWDSQYEFFV